MLSPAHTQHKHTCSHRKPSAVQTFIKEIQFVSKYDKARTTTVTYEQYRKHIQKQQNTSPQATGNKTPQNGNHVYLDIFNLLYSNKYLCSIYTPDGGREIKAVTYGDYSIIIRQMYVLIRFGLVYFIYIYMTMAGEKLQIKHKILLSNTNYSS